jgi:D-sedoheptulose 7-phosphate isomerase
LKYAKKIGAKIVGVVSDRGGYTGRVADACVRIPASHSSSVTAHTEALQALMLHLWVSHPKLQMKTMTWESILTRKKK